MLTKLENEIEELWEYFNRQLESIIRNQAHLKNTIIELKNTLEGINIKLANLEEWISDLEDRLVEINKKSKKNS